MVYSGSVAGIRVEKASKLTPSYGIELYEDGGRLEGAQLRESCGVLVPQADVVDGRGTG